MKRELDSNKEKTRKKHKADREKEHNDPEKVASKLFKYATLGRNSKLRKLLKRNCVDVNLEDAQGNTPLHHACRFGLVESAEILLERGADPNISDRNGNTPGHLAALHHHLPVLIKLLRHEPAPDVELENNDGISVRALTEQLMAAPGLQDPSSTAGVASKESLDWQERLAEEHSGDEDDHLAWQQFEAGWTAGGGAAMETDDEWARRIWQEMQRKRDAERFKGFADHEARNQQQRRQEERKAEAARESARILSQEQARDRGWREAAAGGAAGPPPPPLPPSPPATDISPAAAAARFASMQAAWRILEQAPPSYAIPYTAVPWVVASGEGEGVFAAVLLSGVQGPADIKSRLRREIMRWHPDKFGAAFGARLVAADRERVLARVKEMSQSITKLMAGT